MACTTRTQQVCAHIWLLSLAPSPRGRRHVGAPCVGGGIVKVSAPASHGSVVALLWLDCTQKKHNQLPERKRPLGWQYGAKLRHAFCLYHMSVSLSVLLSVSVSVFLTHSITRTRLWCMQAALWQSVASPSCLCRMVQLGWSDLKCLFYGNGPSNLRIGRSFLEWAVSLLLATREICLSSS